MRNFLEKNHKLIVVAILAFMAVVSLLNAGNDSAIFDETAHIGASYSYVAQHEIRLNPEHPPLLKDLAGLSTLLFVRPNFAVAGQAFWDGTLPGRWDEGQWAAGRYLLYAAGNNPDQIIFWARFPIVLLSLLFGWFLFRWGRELAGTTAGLFALTLYAFDPNVLGHNHFVTTDLGIAAFMGFAFYFYLKFIKHPAWKNVLWAGVFLGLMMLTKFSFITALPVMGLATLVYPLVTVAPAGKNRFYFRLKKLGEYAGKGALVFCLSLVVVWIVYFGNTFRMQKNTMAAIIEADFPVTESTSVKEIYTNKVLHLLNDNSATRPLTNFGIGVSYVFRRVSGGNGAYFLGQVSSQGFRAYFPTVFAIKEPLATLFFMLFALLLALLKFVSSFRKTFADFFRQNLRNLANLLRTGISEVCLFLFVALYAYISITSNLNIGFRHLFPILPFAYLLTAGIIAGFLRNKIPRHPSASSYAHNSRISLDLARAEARESQKIKIFSPAFGVIIAYLILGTIFAYPYYMSYFNETVGGPPNGYHYVTDSNADWGQDLKRLKGFLDEHPEIGLIRTDYFGGGDPTSYLGDKYAPWSDDKRPVEPGWYAISVNFLEGSLYDTAKTYDSSYRWLVALDKKPAYQVGTSILIYDISPLEAKAANSR